jgi:hypothetical protein
MRMVLYIFAACCATGIVCMVLLHVLAGIDFGACQP